MLELHLTFAVDGRHRAKQAPRLAQGRVSRRAVSWASIPSPATPHVLLLQLFAYVESIQLLRPAS
jgi:hypothetical protein